MVDEAQDTSLEEGEQRAIYTLPPTRASSEGEGGGVYMPYATRTPGVRATYRGARTRVHVLPWAVHVHAGGTGGCIPLRAGVPGFSPGIPLGRLKGEHRGNTGGFGHKTDRISSVHRRGTLLIPTLSATQGVR